MRLLAKSAIGHLDAQQLARLTKGVDIIGDIAILKIPDEDPRQEASHRREFA